ncbi:PREDICTED: CASP-like protein 1E2 [Nicotiana attenuata]|uniref:CASP-like protein n=1 Tax=Nicotiana attenuata TaxID=49451 RepID=A0A314KP31_NICAT|nr:PREDICTED: CASP-like protein 1E2 [Nicotiana attenuata]OIT30967.1 casp-like protein 1e2 [Nicotiana attenuata]
MERGSNMNGGGGKEVVGVANKQSIRWTDFGLRFLAFVLTLVAAIVVGVDKQTSVVAVQLVPTLPAINVRATAKWHHMSAFVYFVIVNAIACAYAVISLVLSLANRGKKKGLSLMIILLDLITVALLFSGGGAALAVGLIGYKGNSHVRWNKVCDKFDRFCGQVAAAIVISLVGSALFLLLVLLAVLNLHKNRRL